MVASDKNSGQSHRITLENCHNETYETNLLDETSKFEKNLNSVASWGEIAMNLGTNESITQRERTQHNITTTNGYKQQPQAPA